MPVRTIRLNDYRNYKRSFYEFEPHLNIIVGPNGSGKTNILESIIVVSNSRHSCKGIQVAAKILLPAFRSKPLQ